MIYRIAADVVLLTHFLFIVFVVLGGILVVRYSRLVWLHLPAAAWGIGIEIIGGVCPLTSVENSLRRGAGEAGYTGGFVEHYIVPLVYPEALTPTFQYWLAGLVVAVNLLIYGVIFFTRRRDSRAQ